MNKRVLWLGLVLVVIVATAAVIMQSTSPRVLYASQMGCRLDSDVYNGGGTDDSSALQAALNLASIKGYKLIVDGPALISTNLVIPSNTQLEFLPGAGLFLAAHANTWVLGNLQNTNFASTNIVIRGGIINCNGNSQAEYVNNGFNGSKDPGTWGIWFAGVDGIIMRDTTIMHSKTYALLFSDSRNGYFENLTFYWTNNVALTNTFYGTDSFHSQGNVTNLQVFNMTSIHGNDDVIALMTDETTLTMNRSDPRWTVNGGAMKDIIFDGVYLSPGSGPTAHGARTLSKMETQGGTNAIIQNLTIKNVRGTFDSQGLIAKAPGGSYLRGKNLKIDGFHVSVPSTYDVGNVAMIGLEVLSADSVVLNDIGIEDTAGAGIGNKGYIQIGCRITNSLISNCYFIGSANSVSSSDTGISVISDPFQDGSPQTNSPNISLVNVTARSLGGVIASDGPNGIVRLSNCQVYSGTAINIGGFTNILIMPTNTPTSGQVITATGTSGQTAWSNAPATTVSVATLTSGVWFTNTTPRFQEVRQTFTTTAAAVNGKVMVHLITGQQGAALGTWLTNSTFGQQTTTSSIAQTNVGQISWAVSNSLVYCFTNDLIGAGNAITPRPNTSQVIQY